MKCTQFYPVLMTDNVSATAQFYQKNFRFRPLFETDWYVHLQSEEDQGVNIGIVQSDHPTVPKVGQGSTASLLINFEVDDVDAEYAKAQENGLQIVLPLKDEDFGQRHFITRDPNGVLIDIITQIPPNEEFSEHYIKT